MDDDAYMLRKQLDEALAELAVAKKEIDRLNAWIAELQQELDEANEASFFVVDTDDFGPN